eukprot:jgi/Tetstr1/430699/TSEL_020491.t1
MSAAVRSAAAAVFRSEIRRRAVTPTAAAPPGRKQLSPCHSSGRQKSDTAAAAPRHASGGLRVGDVVRLECESLAVGGDGVCRVGALDGVSGDDDGDGDGDAARGMVCFVHRAWPGEVLWARVTRVKKRWARAVKTESVEAHDAPATPACPHFGPCGGCTLQAIDYEAQLAWKRSWVVDSLRRIAGAEAAEALVRPTVGCEATYAYRNKMEFSFSDTEWLPAGGAPHDDTALSGRWALGKHRPGFHDQVLSIQACSLQGDAMNKVLAVVRREAAAAGLEPYCAARHTGLLRDLVIRRGRDPQTDAPRLLVQFVTRVAAEGVLAPLAAALAAEVLEVAGVVASVAPQRGGGGKPKGPPKLLHGEPVIMERLLGLWFEISAGSFFQTNPEQTEVLYRLAQDAAGLPPGGGGVLLDLYCGTGTIGLSLAGACAEMHGFEVSPSAVADARRNAERNGISNAHFHE